MLKFPKDSENVDPIPQSPHEFCLLLVQLSLRLCEVKRQELCCRQGLIVSLRIFRTCPRTVSISLQLCVTIPKCWVRRKLWTDLSSCMHPCATTVYKCKTNTYLYPMVRSISIAVASFLYVNLRHRTTFTDKRDLPSKWWVRYYACVKRL